MYSLLTIAVTALASIASAQQTYTINPTSVSLSLRQFWCSNQKTQCPFICQQTSADSSVTRQNECDPTSLTYACICSNGLSPNLTQYSQTLPFYICQEWGRQCQSNCGNDATCASACVQDHPCGAQHPFMGNKSTVTSSMATASKTGSGSGGKQTVYTGFAGSGGNGGNGGSSGGQSADGAANTIGYGLGGSLLVGGLLVGFAMLL